MGESTVCICSYFGKICVINRMTDFTVCFRFDDGMVEVFALYSSFHIAQLQVGLAEPLRLGQAKTVKVCVIFKVHTFKYNYFVAFLRPEHASISQQM